jgi:adiponectin receptor
MLVCLALRQHYPASHSNDTTVFAAFFFGIITCFLLSATFHTIANHSDAVAALGNQLDYLGIVLLIWGALVPSIYYGFYCDSELQKVYWAVVSFAALACAIVTVSSVFRSPALRPYRAETQNRRMSITYMIGTAGLNIIGAVVYAARIPEKLHLGRFDIYGQSHQI